MFTNLSGLFRWRREPNYEQELPRLSRITKALRLQLLDAQRRQRRWPFLFLATALLAYLSYVASTLRMSLHAHPKHMAAQALAPFFIYAVHRAIRGLTEWRKTQIEARLATLTERRKRLVEEYKKKTNFYHIQRLVDEGPQDSALLQQQQTQHTGSALVKPDGGANDAARAPGTPKNISAQSSDLDGSVGQRNAHIGSGKPFPEAAKRAFAAELNSIGAAPEAVPVYHTSWVDRILDLLIGENELSPTNRYALICSSCHAHNGLAPYGKSTEEVAYKCPVCGAQNGAQNEQKSRQVKLDDLENLTSTESQDTKPDDEVGEQSAVTFKTRKEEKPESVRNRTSHPTEAALD